MILPPLKDAPKPPQGALKPPLPFFPPPNPSPSSLTMAASGSRASGWIFSGALAALGRRMEPGRGGGEIKTQGEDEEGGDEPLPSPPSPPPNHLHSALMALALMGA